MNDTLNLIVFNADIYNKSKEMLIQKLNELKAEIDQLESCLNDNLVNLATSAESWG